MSIEKLPAYLTNFPMASSQCTMKCIISSVAVFKVFYDPLYHKSLTMTLTHLNAHGLGKPLDDGEEREGRQHGSLVSLSVDNLAESVGAGGEPSAHVDSLQTDLAQGGRTEETQHLVRLQGEREDYVDFSLSTIHFQFIKTGLEAKEKTVKSFNEFTFEIRK